MINAKGTYGQIIKIMTPPLLEPLKICQYFHFLAVLVQVGEYFKYMAFTFTFT